jgi:short subunit dehydrogenase-like uncharacterized protein
MGREYDLLLFGVTGFTGKLAAEYLAKKAYPVKWAACGRNAAKVTAALAALGVTCPVEVADLAVAPGTEAFETLRAAVKKAKVVITCAGPFEKYGQALVQLCVEEGVHYADITGESDYVRMMVEKHHAAARQKGVTVVHHCGNDCIPWDLTVFELAQLAKQKGGTLAECTTISEFPPSSEMSGGTLTTAMYQLSKKRGGAAVAFDPLLTTNAGTKSEFGMKNKSPKKPVYNKEFKRKGAAWLMTPVMVNCVRRSNALLGYNEVLGYAEYKLALESFQGRMKEWLMTLFTALALMVPFFRRFLPQPGEGPSREAMEAGWTMIHGRGKMVGADGAQTDLRATYRFQKDTGYLETAHMLVECGMLLLEKPRATGVVTPAVAFGSDAVARLDAALGAKMEVGCD